MTHVSATAPVAATKVEVTVRASILAVGTHTLVLNGTEVTVSVSKKNDSRNRFRVPAALLGVVTKSVRYEDVAPVVDTDTLSIPGTVNGEVMVVATQHGNHKLVKFMPVGSVLTDTEKKSFQTTLVVTNNRFRLPEDVATSLGLTTNNVTLTEFDMHGWHVRARWARKYSDGGWFEVKVDDSALLVN